MSFSFLREVSLLVFEKSNHCILRQWIALYFYGDGSSKFFNAVTESIFLSSRLAFIFTVLLIYLYLMLDFV